MATRSVTMVVDRKFAEDNELGFACNPSVVGDKSYVNMYLHHDGYPSFRGVELAKWVKHMQEDLGWTTFSDGSRIASHVVKDFHYNAQYLYPSHENIDHQYTYIIWTGKSDVWISCWDQYEGCNVFVNKIDKVIEKYSGEYEYTDWKFYKQNTNKAG